MITIKTLTNGVTIIVDEMPWLNSATVGVWLAAGSLSETAETNGMAHFLEHMAFKGTKNRTAKDIAGSIESRGGSINAYTSYDRTAYHARVLPADVPNALDLFADIVHNSNYADDDIEMECNVIKQEIAMYRDDPQSELFRYHNELIYPDHPMGRAILGTEQTVSSFSHDDFVKFVDTNYIPSNTFIGVAGPVNASDVIKQAESLFETMDDKWVDPLTPAIFNGGMDKISTDHEQTHLVMSFNGVSKMDPRLYAHNVAIGSIGGGMSSRLFQEVREQRGLCYSVSAFADCDIDVGNTIIYSGTGNDSADELVDVVSDLLKRSCTDITQGEIDQAKSILTARTLMSLDTSSGCIENSISQLRTHGRIKTVGEISDEIGAITIDDVKKELQMLCESELAYVVYGAGLGTRTNEELQERLRAG